MEALVMDNSNPLVPLRNEEEDFQLRQLISTAPTQFPNTYIQAATSDNTRRAYRQDIQHFMSWGGLLPTTPEKIICYLHDYAATLNSRTLARRLTALKQWHVCQRFPDPTLHPLVKKTLSGIGHVHGRPKEKAPALTIEQLTVLVEYLNQKNTLQAFRNSALLQLGFFGAFRRSELAQLQWEHINFVAEGMEILIPRSKTDQSGEGQICAIPYGDAPLCPLSALIKWRDISNCNAGFVFRSINKHQQMADAPLSTDGINLIIKSIAIQCQLPHAEKISGHSLRRGFATCASRQGATFVSIMRHGRWRHERTVLGYIEEGQRFEENAAMVLLKKPQLSHSERLERQV